MAEKYWYGGVSGREGHWDFQGIVPFNLDNGGVSTDEGNGLCGLPATGHPCLAGDEIVVAGTIGFNGTHVLDEATTENKLVIPLVYTLESGTNGIVSGYQFTASSIDLIDNGVLPGMILRLVTVGGTQDGDYTIDEITDATHLTITESLSAESGVTFEILRAETFDGTETVTPTTDSNWKLIADGSNTTRPADGDVVHFNDRAYFDTNNKRYQDCIVNVNEAGTGTPNLAGLFVSAGFNGNIGTAGQPVEINSENSDIVIDGESTLYLKLSAGADTDAGCGRLVVNNEKANVTVSSLLNNEVNICLYDLLICLKGYLWIADGCAVSKVVLANYNSSVDGGTSIENVRDNTLCSITAVKGEIIWRSKIDQVDLFDAEFAWGTDDMTEVSGYPCNLLTIYSKSGEFIWQMADATESVIKTFILYAGNLTASQSVNSGYRKKIGTGTEISELWPEATANLNSSSNNVLIAAGSKLESHGGTLIASSGSLLEW